MGKWIKMGGAMVAAAWVFNACNSDNKVSLSRDDRFAVDTLSAKKIEILKIELDKACQDNADALRERLKDSLYTLRKQEISRQMPGIPQ